jgi:hypothetical protein
MRHQLMDPAFPDLVETWAAEEQVEADRQPRVCVNDNDADWASELSDLFLELLARIDIAETRVW